MAAFFCSHSTNILVRELQILFLRNWPNPHACNFFQNFSITESYEKSVVFNYLNDHSSAVLSYGRKTFYFISYLLNAVISIKLHFLRKQKKIAQALRIHIKIIGIRFFCNHQEFKQKKMSGGQFRPPFLQERQAGRRTGREKLKGFFKIKAIFSYNWRKIFFAPAKNKKKRFNFGKSTRFSFTRPPPRLSLQSCRNSFFVNTTAMC